MNRFKNFVRTVVLACFLIPLAFSCASNKYDNTKDIIVLYTNDVHCGIDKNLGYAGLATYKAEMLASTPNVLLVDNGDSIQGEAIGTVSKGEYLTDIMNNAGYDLAIFGNHEFDYGTDQLSALMKKSKFQYLGANIHYIGKGTNKFSLLKPYQIIDFGGTKVAFIGLTTPESIVKSTPRYFMEDGQYVYEFDAGEALYNTTQKYVNEVRAKGAKYVVVLGHLGLEEESAPNRATDVIANTVGIDVFLDGHSHSTVANNVVRNKAGNGVVYSQTGTKLMNIGKLTITPDGRISTTLISKAEKDPATTAFIDGVKAKYEGELLKVVAKSEVDLSDQLNGFRGVRNRETIIGDFCADAYRNVAGADIAFVNGGGIRAGIKKGDITTQDMIKIHPYGNMLCMVETTGQKILDALEHGYRAVEKNANNGQNAVGESGGFLQLSGIRCTIDTSIPSPVRLDDKGFFQGVSGRRRVGNVQVEKNGKWENINPNGKYTVACHNYLLQDMGDGFTMFPNEVYKLDNSMLDNQVIITYVRDFLGGVIKASDYSATKGRITVK